MRANTYKQQQPDTSTCARLSKENIFVTFSPSALGFCFLCQNVKA